MRLVGKTGSLKAPTPFETASTPVIAVQPLAKARMNNHTLIVSRPD